MYHVCTSEKHRAKSMSGSIKSGERAFFLVRGKCQIANGHFHSESLVAFRVMRTYMHAYVRTCA